MSTLSVVPGDLVTSDEDHRTVAGQIDTALAAAAPTVVAMPAAYGPVGVAFVAAIDDFQTTLTATGNALVGQYQTMSDALHNAARLYVTVDEASGVGITSSGSHDAVDRFSDTP